MFQNLLFDLDGTLTNSAEGITKCVQYARALKILRMPDLKKLEVFIGPPLRDSFIKYYGMTREEAEAGVEKYRERYTDIGIWENKVYPGIMELLADLQKDGRRLGHGYRQAGGFCTANCRTLWLQPLSGRYHRLQPGRQNRQESFSSCCRSGKMAAYYTRS